jgi:hypothetical protein
MTKQPKDREMEKTMRIRARKAVATTIAAGAARYDRHRLAHLIPIDQPAMGGGEPQAMILRRLERALRKERACAGHWTYDLNRHIALWQAYTAERRKGDDGKVSQPLLVAKKATIIRK